MPRRLPKKVRCPTCGHEHTFYVTHKKRPVQHLSEDPWAWFYAQCERCRTGFEYSNNEDDRTTRRPPPG
jgi:transcription elongation factor Elf1